MFRGLVREREYYVQGVSQGKRVLSSGLIREESIMFGVNQGREYFVQRVIREESIMFRE